jgi:hypothetical protein
MITSEKTTNLNKAMFEFQQKVQKIKKDSKNPHFKSTYASLANILDAVMPVLTECGIVVAQAPMRDVLITRLTHSESGEFMECQHELVMKDPNNPQAIGSAMSYARRYSLTSMLVLNIDDDDGEAARKATPVVKATTLTMKSKQWKAAEPKIIEWIGLGYDVNAIANEVKSKYVLGKDVIQFIKDQKND